MKTAVLLTLLAAACTKAPEVPTWQGDVMPLFASNCVRCHGRPALFGAPTSFRLDVYEDMPDPDHPGMVIRGAGTMSERAAARVTDGTMPPEFPTVGDAADVLNNWAFLRVTATTNSLFQPPPSGERKGNSQPTITMTPEASGVDVDYQIDDVDFDLVHGVVAVDSDLSHIVAWDLHNGRGTFHVDTSTLTAGSTVMLTAFLDDGSNPFVFYDQLARPIPPTGGYSTSGGEHKIPFEISLTVPATNPSVVFVKPAPFQLISGSQLPVELAITGGVPLTSIQLQLFELAGSGPPAFDQTFTALADVPPSIDVSTLSGNDWVLQATVTDGAGNMVTVRTTQLVIGHTPATEVSFDGLEGQLLDKCANCHDPCASDFSIPNMPHYWAQQDHEETPCRIEPQGMPGSGVVDGVGSDNNPGLIYDRVYRRGDMPPAGQPHLPPVMRGALENYLLAGAPPAPRKGR